MVPVPVPEKIGPGKKYWYQYQKNLVPEKSTGTGTEKILSRKKVPVPVPGKIGPGKKVPVPVPEKILGNVTLCKVIQIRNIYSLDSDS